MLDNIPLFLRNRNAARDFLLRAGDMPVILDNRAPDVFTEHGIEHVMWEKMYDDSGRVL